jgi:hypothetical protein
MAACFMALLTQAQTKDSAGTPELKRLSTLAGEWAGTFRVPAVREAPATQSKLTASCRWILNGRHLDCEFRYTVEEMPFEARMTIGYNIWEMQYRAVWIDNLSTSPMFYSGSINKNGRLVLEGSRKQLDQTVNEKLDVEFSPSVWTIRSSGDVSGAWMEYGVLSAKRKVK